MSADGRYVAYTIGGIYHYIARHDVQTGELELAGEGPDIFVPHAPSLSADGRYVAVISRHLDSAYNQIYRYDFETGEAILVTRNESGGPANLESEDPSISGDGRYIAYESRASDLDGAAPGYGRDVYLFDALEGTTLLISAGPDGETPDESSRDPSMSADGRYVAYTTGATNIAGAVGIVRFDIESGITEFIAPGHEPAISGDGRYVAFREWTEEEGTQIWLHVEDSYSTLASRLASGQAPFEGAFQTAVSADGRYVAFVSGDSELPGMSDGASDNAFVYDAQLQRVTHVSPALDGGASSGHSRDPVLSHDGSLVAYWSALDISAEGSNYTTPDVFLVPRINDRFTDVDEVHIFWSEIEWLAESGITQGCDGNGARFCPNDPVTRGQMAAFLARALKLQDDGGGNTFTDDDGSTFETDIAKIAAAGITNGCDPGGQNFCPNALVTRGQMAAFLARALNLKTTSEATPSPTTTDQPSKPTSPKSPPPASATDATLRRERFCPQYPVTRGQIAAFLFRALGD